MADDGPSLYCSSSVASSPSPSYCSAGCYCWCRGDLLWRAFPCVSITQTLYRLLPNYTRGGREGGGCSFSVSVLTGPTRWETAISSRWRGNVTSILLLQRSSTFWSVEPGSVSGRPKSLWSQSGLSAHNHHWWSLPGQPPFCKAWLCCSFQLISFWGCWSIGSLKQWLLGVHQQASAVALQNEPKRVQLSFECLSWLVLNHTFTPIKSDNTNQACPHSERRVSVVLAEITKCFFLCSNNTKIY